MQSPPLTTEKHSVPDESLQAEADFQSLLIDSIDITSQDDTLLETRAHAFWAWFQANEERIFSIVLDENNVVIDKYMDCVVAIEEASHLVDQDVGVEIDDQIKIPGKRTLVLTGNGISRAFQAVEMLFETCPGLKRWHLVKYRQRESVFQSIQIRDCVLNSDDVRFSIGKHANTSEFSIFMFMPGFEETEQNTWEHIGFVLMDNILGELDVATKIKSISFHAPEDRTDLDRLKVGEFVRKFDAVFLKSRH